MPAYKLISDKVEARLIMDSNLVAIAEWCHGETRELFEDDKIINVIVLIGCLSLANVARIGSYIVKQMNGFAVVGADEFHKSFVEDLEEGV